MFYREIIGDEVIVWKNDYIVYDLDEYIFKEYNVFVLEVLLSRLFKVVNKF